jgi:gliding motility-associated-like protein
VNYYILVLFILTTHILSAQGNKYLGFSRCALRFEENMDPVFEEGFFSSSPRTNMAIATDDKDNILLYSDAINIYNSDHEIINGGQNLQSTNTYSYPAHQCLFVKNSVKPNSFYLFTLAYYQADSINLDYVEVNLAENQTWQVYRTVSLISDDSLRFNLNAVEFQEIGLSWLVVSRTPNELLAYRIDENGVNTEPIITPLRNNLNRSPSQMDFARDGTTVALSESDFGFYILRFNPLYGTFTEITKQLVENGYDEIPGISFSKNRENLFLTQRSGSDGNQNIFQYDVTDLKNPVLLTKYNLNNGSFFQMEFGGDGNIYLNKITGTETNYISRISDVDNQNPIYEEDFIEKPRNCRSGFLMPKFCTKAEPWIELLSKNACSNDVIKFEISHWFPADSIIWDFGNNNIVSGNQIFYSFDQEGNYSISATIYNSGVIKKIEQDLLIFDSPKKLGDREIASCDSVNLRLLIDQEYEYVVNGEDSLTWVNSTGDYYLELKNKNGCTVLDTLSVLIDKTPNKPKFDSLYEVCDTKIANFTINYPEDLNWYDNSWSLVSITESFYPMESGTFFASQMNGNCESERTSFKVLIKETPNPPQFIKDSIAICIEPKIIDIDLTDFTYSYINNSRTEGLDFNSLTDLGIGLHQVLFSNNLDGCESDLTPVSMALQESDFSKIDIPNAFTPNNDRINDTFYIKTLPNEKCMGNFKNFTVVDRTGSVVFQTQKRDFNWIPKNIQGIFYYNLSFDKFKHTGYLNIIK